MWSPATSALADVLDNAGADRAVAVAGGADGPVEPTAQPMGNTRLKRRIRSFRRCGINCGTACT
jgi:hypothetical protein